MNYFVIVLVSLVVILVLANGYALWRQRPSKMDETIYHFNCPECGKRLRYRATQAGHKGMCPRCRAGWDFPPLPEKKKK
jgi:predicted RNA-binding Zn-ribbon protein involved in translation (DUF1610 family)